ncbi:rhodanese-like domain-containing protein, partial [Brachyspira pilosicoli]|nr:rhodanese-like domain-containing protein [Brachyspira pilosicoli]
MENQVNSVNVETAVQLIKTNKDLQLLDIRG